MIIKLNTALDIPIYLQLRNQIVMGIGRGELKIGDSLPTVRQLAQDAGVNTMTVNKTYQLLKLEGFIEIDRRHGAKVCPDLNKKLDFSEKLEYDLELLSTEAALKGYSKDDFMTLCSRIFDRIQLTECEGTL